MPSKTASNAVVTDSQPVSAPVGSSGSGRNSVTENQIGENAGLPQQILGIVQHKWRNLEKRKKKLDEYKKIGDANLKADQREALSHFGEVVQLLDLLGDMKKQFETAFTEYETQQKKQAKREKQAQRQRDAERTREVLEIRLVLNTLGDETLRADLRRANKVSDVELNLIDKFYEVVEPTSTSCDGGKTEAFLTAATDNVERLLRKEEKPFVEKQSYAHLRGILGRLYHSITESSSQATSAEVIVKHDDRKQHQHQGKRSHHEPAEETVETHRPQKHSEEAPADVSSRLAPTSPHHSVNAPPHPAANVPQQAAPATKLEEIVKPGSFSFLQESQISSSGAHGQNRQGHPREQHFTNDYSKSSNNDQQPGAWQRSPGRPNEPVAEQHFEERANTNHPPAWSNRGGAAPAEAAQRESYPNSQAVPYHEGGAQGRNRERGGRPQHHQQQRNRRPFVPSGGADENNEAAAGGWPADDADFSEWKSVEAGSGQNRDGGPWIGGGQDNRRRGGGGGGSGRGGSGGRGFHRGGGQNNAGGFGDNRRHFNRGGPRPGGPNNQQPRPAAAAGVASGQAFAE